MAVLKYLLGNLKKRKSYSIVICILVFISGLILTVTASTAQNADKAYDEAFNHIKGPHLMYWMEEKSYRQEYKQWFEKQPDVESVKAVEERYVNGAVLEHDGAILRSNTVNHILEYNPADNMKLVDGVHSPDAPLSKGEIILPYIYKTSNKLSVGDQVVYRFGTNVMNFKVLGFAEEPIFGGDLHGAKFLFISGEDMAKFLELGGDSVLRNIQIRVHFTNYSESAVYKMADEFSRELNVNTGTVYSYGSISSGHLTLPRISLVVMIAFVLILCIITITIMRYAILATIEADFVNIGIVKALGFTPMMVQAAITGQYVLLALVSGILSLIAGIFITPVLGSVILDSTGLYYNGRMSVIIGLMTLSGLVLVISLFSYLTARRTKKISPVRAISQGIAPVYFSSRLNLRLQKIGFLPFNLRMALKQVLTKSKRYILLLFISALLTYTLVFLLGLVQIFNSEKSLNMLGGELSDIRVSSATKAETRNIIGQIQKDYDTVWATYQKTTQLIIDGGKTTVRIKDDFEATGELFTLSGRHPRHENEVAISELLSKRFNKGVGDTLMIKDKDGGEHPFIITGTFQTIDDGGTYVRMLESGILTLDNGFELNTAYVKFKSHDNLDTLIGEMKDRYSGYQEIANERKFTNDKLGTIQGVFSSVSKLVFVLTLVIISFITLLIMKITVYSETRELGIYKALGFSSARMRLQLALRFVLVTVIGGLIGAVVETIWGSEVFSLLLNNFGLSSFRIEFSIINAAIPVAAIALLAILSAYVSSGNTKKVSVYALINE